VHEADHSSPSSAEAKNEWSCTSTSSAPSWRGAQLKHRGSFTFTSSGFISVEILGTPETCCDLEIEGRRMEVLGACEYVMRTK
jgi:hypothetical protein